MSATAPRAVPAQKPPLQTRDDRTFPTLMLAQDSNVYRAINSTRTSPGFYSSNMDGRFDLTAPAGTMYVADSLRVAVRERLGSVVSETQAVYRAEAETMKVAAILTPWHMCADIESGIASSFEVTGELHSMTPYDIPQSWAAVFFSAGHTGIHYGARFSPGNDKCWALFGPAGPAGTKSAGPDVDGVEACKLSGIRVLARCGTVIPPPI